MFYALLWTTLQSAVTQVLIYIKTYIPADWMSVAKAMHENMNDSN